MGMTVNDRGLGLSVHDVMKRWKDACKVHCKASNGENIIPIFRAINHSLLDSFSAPFSCWQAATSLVSALSLLLAFDAHPGLIFFSINLQGQNNAR